MKVKVGGKKRRDKIASNAMTDVGLQCARTVGSTHDCALLEPLALPPDLPPPVILMGVDGKGGCG